MEREFYWIKTNADPDGNESIHYAAAAGNLNLLNNSIVVGCNINAENRIGWTAMMQAARNGQTECVITLIKFGADVLHRNRYGICMLSLAVASGNLSTVQVVLRAFNDRKINLFRLKEYISPIFFAVLFNNVYFLQYLCLHSYHLNCKLHLGDLNSATVANILNRQDILYYLKICGIDICKMSTNLSSPKIENIPRVELDSTCYNTPIQLNIPQSPNLIWKVRKSSNCRYPSDASDINLSPISIHLNNSIQNLNDISPNISADPQLNAKIIMPTVLRFSSSSTENSFPIFTHLDMKLRSSSSIDPSIKPFQIEEYLDDEVFNSGGDIKQPDKLLKMLRKHSLDSCMLHFK